MSSLCTPQRLRSSWLLSRSSASERIVRAASARRSRPRTTSPSPPEYAYATGVGFIDPEKRAPATSWQRHRRPGGDDRGPAASPKVLNGGSTSRWLRQLPLLGVGRRTEGGHWPPSSVLPPDKSTPGPTSRWRGTSRDRLLPRTRAEIVIFADMADNTSREVGHRMSDPEAGTASAADRRTWLRPGALSTSWSSRSRPVLAPLGLPWVMQGVCSALRRSDDDPLRGRPRPGPARPPGARSPGARPPTAATRAAVTPRRR
jgi:hypothetical protein